MTGESLENEFVGATHLVPSLRTRVVRGGFWVFALRIADRLFRLGRTIVLARLLAPEHFGLFAIALLAMSAVETFSQTGFNAALIQKKEETKSYLDTAWTVHAIRGILLALIVFAIAPYVAAFFESPAAKPILQVIALSVLLGGLGNIGVIYFRKDLEFHKEFVYLISGTLTDISVAITMAFLLRNVWALVFGLLAGNLGRTVVSYIIHPYRPRLRFNQKQFKELFGFGKWLLGSGILLFLITHGDDAFVGKVLGVTALGFYQLAYRLSNIPTTEITHVISQVTIPAYSKLQDNLPRLREAYLKVLQLTAFLSFPIAGLIFVLAPDFTRIFLGQKWMPMVSGMQGLVLAGLVRSIMATTGPIFLAVGRPQIETKWQVVRFIVLGASIYPLSVRWGILGVAIAVLLSNLISTVGFIRMAIKITTCKKRAFAKVITFPLISCLLMASLVFALKAGSSRVEVWGFFLLTGVGGLSYLSVIYLLDRYLNYKMKLLLRENLGCIRRI